MKTEEEYLEELGYNVDNLRNVWVKEAMRKYAVYYHHQRQFKFLNLRFVIVRFFEGWLIPKKCTDCGKRKWTKGYNVCPDCMGGLDIF